MQQNKFKKTTKTCGLEKSLWTHLPFAKMGCIGVLGSSSPKASFFVEDIICSCFFDKSSIYGIFDPQ
jgi:hypothetical protein